MPTELSLRTRLSYFGRFPMWLGVIFFGVGLLFACFFYVSTATSRLFSDDDLRVEGTVTKVSYPTLRGGKGTGLTIRYAYRYQVAGRSFDGESRSYASIDAGPVRVQYIPDKPQASRIEGMRTGEFPGWFLLMFAIASGAAGSLLVAISARAAFTDLRRLARRA